MTLPIYMTGTVSVANLGTVVTGVGCMWSGINAREGDFFVRADGTAVITEVTDATHLKITPWPGATVAGGAYAIQQNYVGRVVGVAAAEDVGVMLEKLHVDGLPFILGADETVPDPSYGDEGQLAFKPSTGQWWVKQGGVWVPSLGLTALGYGGTSATSLVIGLGTKVFTTQGSLAYNGARVRAASAANLANWMEGPASYSGTTLTMACDKISGAGTHADWLFSIAGQPGQSGTGSGDLLKANNLSELTPTAAIARINISAVGLAGDTMTGPLTLTGAGSVLTSAARPHKLGSVSAAAIPPSTAPTQADASIVLYDGGPQNWAGIGIDNTGTLWLRTGLGPAIALAALWVDPSQIVNFLNSPLAPTPAIADSSNKVATTAFVKTQLSAPATKVVVLPGVKLSAFGDSITVGLNATTATVTGYAARLGAATSTKLSNWAVSGSASNRATKEAYAHLVPFGRRSDLTTWAASHNEVYRGGSNPKTLTKTRGELRAFIANAMLATAVPASALTQTPAWSDGTGINEKAISLGGRIRFTATVGNTITGSFTGDNLVVGCFNADGVTYHVGTFTVSVDGATSGAGFATFNGDGGSDGISDGVYDNLITHDACILRGLGAGSHTFTIKVTVAPSAAYPVYIDYVGTMQPPNAAPPVIVSESSRPNAAGYSLGGGFWSPAAFDGMDAAIHQVVAEFANYPVGIARVSAYQNTTTDISADNEHPNDLGHLHLQQAFSEVVTIRPYFVATTDLRKTADQSTTSGAYNAIIFDNEDSDDDGLHSNTVNPTRITLAYAGTFRFEGNVAFAINSTGIREVYLFKNGVGLGMLASAAAMTGDDTVMPFFTKIIGVAGDYYELMAIQSSGGPLNVKLVGTFLSVSAVR